MFLKNVVLFFKIVTYPICDQNGQIDILFMTQKRLKYHTLWGRTYLYGPHKGVLPGSSRPSEKIETPQMGLITGILQHAARDAKFVIKPDWNASL